MTENPRKSRKSANDFREYRLVRLKNEIKAILISDIKPIRKNFDRSSTDDEEKEEPSPAAAALHIAAGNFDEPPHLPGSFNILQHALMKGSEKYPVTNTYSDFIDEHGGSTTAYTVAESTAFHFTIDSQHLDAALDIFSSCFVDPLLTVKMVEGALEDLSCSSRSNMSDDTHRCDTVIRTRARRQHPYSKFPMGSSWVEANPDIGVTDLANELRSLFETCMSKRQTTLALCAPISLDELEEMANKHFCAMTLRPRVKLLNNIHMDNPFEGDQFHRLVIVEPVETVDTVKLNWLLPPQQRHYKKNPTFYISSLFSHTCEGSLYKCLKDRGLITSISAYNTMQTNYLAQFTCSIDVTRQGLDHIADIVHIVFQFINMIRCEAPTKSRQVYKHFITYYFQF